MKIVCYYRVSTAGQGKSGLGIEAQKASVLTYLNGGSWKVIGEFTEVETGKRADRPQLALALAVARLHKCPLVVAKVDRLSRSQSFLNRLLDAGVDVRFADLPQIEGPTGRFMLQQMAAVAELEGGMISARTKAALAAAKARGVKLGGDRGFRQDAASAANARAARTVSANDRANEVMPAIKALQARGIVALRPLANGLTEAGIPTASGKAVWSMEGVRSVLARSA